MVFRWPVDTKMTGSLGSGCCSARTRLHVSTPSRSCCCISATSASLAAGLAARPDPANLLAAMQSSLGHPWKSRCSQLRAALSLGRAKSMRKSIC